MTQKIIRSVNLYNDNNGSDKVINMFIVEVEGGFLMNYENGPKGGTMVPRTKTPSPVSLVDAEKEWDKLFKAKVKPTEYRVMDLLSTEDSYTAPTLNKEYSGKATMMLGEVKDDNHRESLLNDPNYVVQEKFDGEFLKIIVSEDVIKGSNKKGVLINVRDNLAKELRSMKRSFEVDGEFVGPHFYAFELPSLDGKSALDKYGDRHQELSKLLLTNAYIHVVQSSGTTRESKLSKIKEIANRGGEGVVFKNLRAPYEPGISDLILKDKFTASATVCVLEHNESIESVVVGALDHNGIMQKLNSVGTPKGKPPIGSIVEVEYLYANPATNRLQQPVFKSVRPEQELSDCKISQFKYKTALDHGLFSSIKVTNSDIEPMYIHGNWSHIFHSSGPETNLRFVFDKSSQAITDMEISKSLGWVKASSEEIADVQDSLLNANDEALDSPDEWGLELSSIKPNWALAKKTKLKP